MKNDTHIFQIRREQLKLLFEAIPLSSLVNVINGCIVYFVLASVTSTTERRIWLVTLFAVALLRLLLFLHYKKTAHKHQSLQIYHRLFSLGSFVSGCVWGLLSILLFPVDSVLHQAFVSFVIAGMTAAAVTTLSAYWLSATLFILPALIPLIVRFLQIDDFVSEAMGVMVILYTFILLGSIRRNYTNIQQNIRLRFEAGVRDKELTDFKSTLDQTLDCVFMFDANTLKFFYANQGALSQVGYSYDELYKMHPYDIKPAYNREQFIVLVAALMNSNNPATTFETIHQHKDGHTIPVEIFLQYINSANGDAHFVAIVRDITERKRLDRIKDEFVSTVSHELRTPLTALRGSLGLITGGAVGAVTEKQQDLLNIAQQNTERLLFLINDILDIQKIETGNTDFHFTNLDLNSLVNKALHENQAYAAKYHVGFNFTAPDFDCPVHVDPNRIIQVMTNMLSNAAKFSPPHTEILIAIEKCEESFRVTVTDAGQGIPADFEAKVFDKFTQSDATDQRVHGGTGLGLAIAKSIIERHHGQIGFTTKIGQGTTFYFELPNITKKTLL